MTSGKYPRDGIKTFILPNHDKQASSFINDPEKVITLKEKFPMPRDGVIILYIEYLDYGTNSEDDKEEIF